MALSTLLKLPPFRRRYAQARAHAGPFASGAITALDIEIVVAESELSRIPPKGPLVVMANHPHGLLDGLLLADVLGRVRGDARVVTNYLAASIPEVADLCFFVDPFGGRLGAVRSRAGLKRALAWLRRGGALVVFPSGEVAHRDPARTPPTDGPWLPTAARLARAADAVMLPVCIDGRNSRLFYAAGRLHPMLRTALLPRELLAQHGRKVAVHLGAPVRAGMYADADDCTRDLRRRVDGLGAQLNPIARARPATALAADIAALPDRACLAGSGDLRVYVAGAHALPNILPEIGRLREQTFRAVGEGTGKSSDLDEFDEWYHHLFVWNPSRQEVVGAYRIGATDSLLRERGIAGLYTRTLFAYDDRLIDKLSPALELGRSFVRAEYQRHSSALMLLWKGIATFVARMPRYRVLFGPVTISSRYRDESQRLLMAFLAQNHSERGLAELVRALNPVPLNAQPHALHGSVTHDLTDVDRLIAQIEGRDAGMPVLLRQYLRLNATLLGFNIDPAFGNALDALMFVDLRRVDRAILARYMGRAEAGQYLAHHADLSRRLQMPRAS